MWCQHNNCHTGTLAITQTSGRSEKQTIHYPQSTIHYLLLKFDCLCSVSSQPAGPSDHMTVDCCVMAPLGARSHTNFLSQHNTLNTTGNNTVPQVHTTTSTTTTTTRRILTNKKETERQELCLVLFLCCAMWRQWQWQCRGPCWCPSQIPVVVAT